jgi:serine O-acetyltransferase
MECPDAWVDQLLDSYRECGGINHVDGVNLPSKRAVERLTYDFLRLLFPGYMDEKVLHSRDLASSTRHLLCDGARRLEEEVVKSFEFVPRHGDDPRQVRALARRVVETLVAALPSVRELLVTDVQAAYEGDPAAQSLEEVIVAYPCIEAIAVQRLAHILYLQEVALIPRIMTEWAHSRTGIDLHPGARIGGYFFIDHGTGVVVGETCRIGLRVKLYQGVTLGAKSFKKDARGRVIKGTQRHPIIGDDVTIYAGATILGGDTEIGDRTTVAGNVWLTHSVPPDSLVSFQGQKIVVLPKTQNSDEGDEMWSAYEI